MPRKKKCPFVKAAVMELRGATDAQIEKATGLKPKDRKFSLIRVKGTETDSDGRCHEKTRVVASGARTRAEADAVWRQIQKDPFVRESYVEIENPDGVVTHRKFAKGKLKAVETDIQIVGKIHDS